MSRFIVIKKNTILSYLIGLLITISLLLSFYYMSLNKKTENTLANVNNSNELSLDLNGDGEKEYLEIITEKNTYVVKVKNSSTEYILMTSDNSKIIGEFISSYPLKVTTLDLSRDGIPEIVIRTIKNSQPISYIFTWNKDNFSNIYTSSNNILGFLDSNNSKTPKILSIISSKGDSSTTSFIFNSSTIKDISFSKTTVPSLNLVQTFIDLIESPYELYDTPDIFSDSINSSELGLLWNLNKDISNYSFQSGYFYDSTWDNSGNISSLVWCLSFENVKNLDATAPHKELLIYLTLKKDSTNELKISSIKKT
ncbi:MAG: hypothetical protein ACRC68_03435 [Clostridium sp.]